MRLIIGKSSLQIIVGFILMIVAFSLSIHSQAEQQTTNLQKDNLESTQSQANYHQLINQNLAASAKINANQYKNLLGTHLAKKHLNIQDNSSIDSFSSSTNQTNNRSTIAVATLLNATNLPGRYIGNTKVSLIHY